MLINHSAPVVDKTGYVNSSLENETSTLAVESEPGKPHVFGMSKSFFVCFFFLIVFHDIVCLYHGLCL